jgi:hypothetical protein
MINAILGTTLIAVALMGSFYLGAHCAFRAVRKALELRKTVEKQQASVDAAYEAMKEVQEDEDA